MSRAQNRMITANELDPRLGASPHQVRGLPSEDVPRGRVGKRLDRPIRSLAQVGAPLDIVAGEEVRPVRVHEYRRNGGWREILDHAGPRRLRHPRLSVCAPGLAAELTSLVAHREALHDDERSTFRAASEPELISARQRGRQKDRMLERDLRGRHGF